MEILALLIVLAIFAWLVWFELSRYGRLKLAKKDTPKDRAQLGRRLVSGTVFLIVTLMGFGGIHYLDDLKGNPKVFLGYWSVCFALILGLVVLLAFDLYVTSKRVFTAYFDESAEEARFREFMERQVKTDIRGRSVTRRTER